MTSADFQLRTSDNEDLQDDEKAKLNDFELGELPEADYALSEDGQDELEDKNDEPTKTC